jgi:hypothetical protein
MASLATSAAAAAATEVTHLSQRDAVEIDQQLMGPLGFSVDQLMVTERKPPPRPFHLSLLVGSRTDRFI